MNTSNRVAINTAMIYVSMFAKILIGLFSVRIVLQALGETDYGIVMVVGGIIATLDILSVNMSNTSMRNLAHSLGSGDEEIIRKTFNSTVFLHYIIGLLSVVILEVGGWLMFKYFVNIPIERILIAKIIYQFSILSALISVIAVPYDAVINAHEHIWVLSIFNIFQSILNLLVALFLLNSSSDRLLLYGLSLFLIQIILRVGKTTYSKRHFSECRHFSMKNCDPYYVRKILNFTGWALIGNVSAVASTHLTGIIENKFFGVRYNASDGIAKSVSNYIDQFATSITRAINPQIMKSEGGGNRDRMKYTIEVGAKYSAFLISLVGIPFIIEMPYILKIWLKDVPELAVIFCQLTILNLIIDKFSNQMNVAIYAVGKIKIFQIIESALSLCYLPVIFYLYKIGYPPITIYVVIIIVTLLKYLDRFYFGHKIAGISLTHYTRNVIIPVLLPLLFSSVCVFFISRIIPEGINRLLGCFCIFAILHCGLFYGFGIPFTEKQIINNIIKSIFKKYNYKRPL